MNQFEHQLSALLLARSAYHNLEDFQLSLDSSLCNQNYTSQHPDIVYQHGSDRYLIQMHNNVSDIANETLVSYVNYLHNAALDPSLKGITTHIVNICLKTQNLKVFQTISELQEAVEKITNNNESLHLINQYSSLSHNEKLSGLWYKALNDKDAIPILLQMQHETKTPRKIFIRKLSPQMAIHILSDELKAALGINNEQLTTYFNNIMYYINFPQLVEKTMKHELQYIFASPKDHINFLYDELVAFNCKLMYKLRNDYISTIQNEKMVIRYSDIKPMCKLLFDFIKHKTSYTPYTMEYTFLYHVDALEKLLEKRPCCAVYGRNSKEVWHFLQQFEALSAFKTYDRTFFIDISSEREYLNSMKKINALYKFYNCTISENTKMISIYISLAKFFGKSYNLYILYGHNIDNTGTMNNLLTEMHNQNLYFAKLKSCRPSKILLQSFASYIVSADNIKDDEIYLVPIQLQSTKNSHEITQVHQVPLYQPIDQEQPNENQNSEQFYHADSTRNDTKVHSIGDFSFPPSITVNAITKSEVLTMGPTSSLNENMTQLQNVNYSNPYPLPSMSTSNAPSHSVMSLLPILNAQQEPLAYNPHHSHQQSASFENNAQAHYNFVPTLYNHQVSSPSSTSSVSHHAVSIIPSINANSPVPESNKAIKIESDLDNHLNNRHVLPSMHQSDYYASTNNEYSAHKNIHIIQQQIIKSENSLSVSSTIKTNDSINKVPDADEASDNKSEIQKVYQQKVYEHKPLLPSSIKFLKKETAQTQRIEKPKARKEPRPAVVIEALPKAKKVRMMNSSESKTTKEKKPRKPRN